MFKAFVNTLATTKIENGEKYIILRKEFYPADGECQHNSSFETSQDVSVVEQEDLETSDQLSVSVKERTQKFNRLASQTDITSLAQRRLSERVSAIYFYQKGRGYFTRH